MIWVVDTSAVVRLFVPDGPLHPGIEAAMNRAMHGSDVVLAPDLMPAESANALLRKRRRGELSSGEARKIIGAIASLPVRIEPHAPLLVAAFNLSAHCPSRRPEFPARKGQTATTPGRRCMARSRLAVCLHPAVMLRATIRQSAKSAFVARKWASADATASRPSMR